jgi:general secretion pathway protein N
MTMTLPKPQMFLIALCGLLGAFLLYEIFAPLAEVAVPTLQPRESIATLPLQTPFQVLSLASFAAFNERPIFSAQRKPIAPAPVGAAASAPPPPPTATLVGIIIDPQRQMALIRTPSSPLAVAVTVGQTVQGWQVSEIAPDRVVLHRGTTDDTLKLEANRAPAATPDAKTTPQQDVKTTPQQ